MIVGNIGNRQFIVSRHKLTYFVILNIHIAQK